MSRTWIVLSLAGILPVLGSTRPASAHATPCNLIARTPQESEWFGFALAAQDSRLAVGAPGDPGAAEQGSGAVYVLRRNGSGWSQEARLRTDGGRESRFGAAVALKADRLAVGAPAAHGERVPGAGAVFLYSRSSGSWEPESPARVMAPDGARGDRFGAAVALGVTDNLDTLVVGAPSDGDAGSLSGAVYVFRRAGDRWGPAEKLRAPDAQATDQFGAVVAIEGDRLVVGAPFADELPRRRNSGAVYVFRWNGERWRLQKKLKPPFEEDDVQFGASVAVAGGRLVVGAPGEDRGAINRGAAYLFGTEGSEWSQPVRLAPVDPEWEAGDHAGSSVAIDRFAVAVGAPFHRRDGARVGAVYRFSGSGAPWTEISPPQTGVGSSAGDRFGSSVAIAQEEIFIGGPLAEVGQANAGAVAVCPLGAPPTADLSIKKSDQPRPVCVGDRLTYEVTVRNRGPSAVTGARVTDRFIGGPPGAHLRDLRWESSAARGEGEIDQLVELPPDGELRYKVFGTVAGRSGTFSNRAHVEAPDGVEDPDLRNNSPPAVITRVSGVDLFIAATAPIAICGGTLSYPLTVINRGSAAASGVQVVVQTPPGLPPLPPPGCQESSGEIVCSLGTLGAGRRVDIPIVFGIPDCFSGGSPIRAVVRTADKDCDSLDDEVVTPVSIDCSTELGIAKVSDVKPGGALSSTVKIRNQGGHRACEVVLSDPVPPGLSVTSLPAGCDLTANKISCSFDSLDPGQTRSFALEFMPAAGCQSPIINTATVRAKNAPAASASATTPVDCCELAISKTDGLDTAMPGQTVLYTIGVSNTGDFDVKATVEDVFPTGLSAVQWCRDIGAPCVPDRSQNLEEIISLPVGGSASYRVRGIVDPKFTGTLTNTAFISAPDCEATATDVTEIGFTGVKVFCTGIDGLFIEGGMITFTFLLINGGPAAQADNPGDEFTDTLPAGLTLTGASADSGTAATAGSTATWNGSIPVGGMVMITVTATIDAGTLGMTLCNQATVAFDGDGNGTNESFVLSDDPSQPGDADACCLTVLPPMPIPALSKVGLAALTLLLAVFAWRRLRARGT